MCAKTVPRLIHMCAMTHLCVPWLIYMCAVTHLFMRHDSFICVPWRIYVCAVTHSYVCRDCATTHSYVCRNSFICVPRLIYMCAVAYLYVCHDSCIRVSRARSVIFRYFSYRYWIQHIETTNRTSINESCRMHVCVWYGLAPISKLLKIISLFCRISSLSLGSFAKRDL